MNAPLFDPPFPFGAIIQPSDTSRAAAESIAPTAELLREQCFASLRDHGPATADAVAARLDLSILSVRPRFTELKKAGRIVDTGLRAKNASGRSAAVWKAA